MKFLITESKLNDTVFKYLDNQDFIEVKRSNEICFLNSSDDLWAVMKYRNGKLIISDELTHELELFFSIDLDYAEIIIKDWVSNEIGKDIDIWDVRTLGGMMADVNLSM